MSIHQTSVYLGTAGGAFLAGQMAESKGWRSPFWALGLSGMAYAVFLGVCLVEPVRKSKDGQVDRLEPTLGDEPRNAEPPSFRRLVEKILIILTNPAAALLLAVFVGANFVAATFLAWLPLFIHDRFHTGLADSSTISTVWSLSSLVGALYGGIAADWAARRLPSGRILVQSLGLMIGAPFVFLAGHSPGVELLIAALCGAGLGKGIYDANIFAALFDVVPAHDRGIAAGLMNTVGWTGGSLAPYVVAFASRRFGLGVAIASTAAVYLIVSLLALAAARLARSRLIS
jgi:MFS family permease